MDIRQGGPNPNINYKRRQERSINELTGIIQGILADNKVVESELTFLLKWLENNKDLINTWPANRIYERLCNAFEDGVIDQEEEKELVSLLKSTVGHYPTQEKFNNFSTTLPLDNPPPKVSFFNKLFCFTGTFVFGKRKECHHATATLGGIIKNNVVMDLDYLVIGNLATADWIHSRWGRKIEKALSYKKQGMKIAIIHEDYWVEKLLEYDSNILAL